MSQRTIPADQQRTPAGLAARRARTVAQRFRTRRRWSWHKRGQALVIFALTITFLLGLAGLAIDVVRAYDLYARELRAAEAGALAGDLYMPCFYNSTTSASGCGPGTSPDNNSAQTAALTEVQKNGFGNGVALPASCTGADSSAAVTVCMNSTGPTALQVTVTQPINVFFLSVIGISTFNVSATAAANYLPNTILGTGGGGGGGNIWGGGGVSNPKTFLDLINGPAEFQEQGDPFVYCQDGPTAGPPPDGDFSTATTPLTDSVTNTVAGFNTNHAPFGGGPECGTSKDVNNLQPPGFGGQYTPNGNDVYDFELSTPAAAADVYIWNPNYDPGDLQSSCEGAQTPDIFLVDQTCTQYYQQYGPITFDGTHFDDPRMYFNMTYSVWSTPLAYGDPGTLVFGQTFAPVDTYSADVALHCPGFNGYSPPAPPAKENSTYDGPVVPLLAGTCTNLNGPGFQVGSWAKIGTVQPGSYRMTAEATTYYPKDGCAAFTCGWGRHAFTVAICAVGTSPGGNSCTAPDPSSFVAPLNDADIYGNFPGKTTVSVPVAYIPAAYAGRSITISVFNSGYSHGNSPNVYFTFVPPDCSPINIPTTSANWYRVANAGPPPATPTCTPGAGIYNWVYASARGKPGDFIYHGLWVDIPITLPANYPGGQWYFDQIVANGAKDFFQMCLKVSVNGGSPVHLIL